LTALAVSFTTRPLLVCLAGGLGIISAFAIKALVAVPSAARFLNRVIVFFKVRSNNRRDFYSIIITLLYGFFSLF